jgi:uncharacterized protein (TIGR02466 family)
MNTFHHAIFPSIVTETKCHLYKNIRNDLIKWIYEYQSKTESVIYSNRGEGWQSPGNFYLQESFYEYKNYILNNALQALSCYNRKFNLANMWININGRESHNITHCHPSAILAGVLWVKISENCGDLVFDNPKTFDEHTLIESIDKNIGRDRHYSNAFVFTPQEGTIVLFPAHLYHHVEPNKSNEDRISIAFNLNT